MGISRRVRKNVRKEVRGLRPAWREIPAWLMGRRTRLRVTGHSMEPLLKAGDFVLMQKNRRSAGQNARLSKMQVGEIVVLRHPHQPEQQIIKQIAEIKASKSQLRVLGTQPEMSTDSRTFGWIDHALILGKVTYIAS